MNAGTVMDILHVDDSEDDLLFLQEIVGELDFPCSIRTAINGDEALSILRREGKYRDAGRPNLVLLDIRMPGKDGFEVLKEIKSDPALRMIPVAMLTSSDRRDDVHRAYGNCACGYITKPMNINQFADVMKKFLVYWKDVSRLPKP
ncbi:response regulator [bacterium]|nr:response regulator [bacterium]